MSGGCGVDCAGVLIIYAPKLRRAIFFPPLAAFGLTVFLTAFLAAVFLGALAFGAAFLATFLAAFFGAAAISLKKYD